MSKYNYFPKYILRSPLLPLSDYLCISGDKYLDFRKTLLLPAVKEAIFLASPKFHYELYKSLNSDEANEKLLLSAFKYISRMYSRPTPFGLFAGCSVGEIGSDTLIRLNDVDSNRRKTRLDMEFLYAFGKFLGEDIVLKKELKFYPNETLYRIGNEYRYVECISNDGKRSHELSSIQASVYIDKILKKSASGQKIEVLAQEITSEEIDNEEARFFIDELISNEVLICELEPSVSGDEYLEQLIYKLKKIKNAQPIVEDLEKISESLEKLDKLVGVDISEYTKITNSLRKYGITINEKFLYQCDMETSVEKSTLNKKNVYLILETLEILNGFDFVFKNPTMEKFKEDFQKRYGDAEVSLAEVLDVQHGIGYGADLESFITPDLLENIDLERKTGKKNKRTVIINDFQEFLLEKILDNSSRKGKTISLKKNEIIRFKRSLDGLPPTFTTMIELASEANQQKMLLTVIGGESGANLLTRFCYLNDEIKTHVQDIIEEENKANRLKNVIAAEVTHLPHSRTGNVVMKPQFRDYEIPYLSNCNLDSKKKIQLNDLLVSVGLDGRVKLRSKTLKKEIKAYLTHAHNYVTHTLSVYRFLGDLQHQGRSVNLGLIFTSLYDTISFIPRIEYNGIILSKATWNFNKSDLASLSFNLSNKDNLKNSLKDFKKKFQLNDLIVLVDGDNELLVNLKNITSVMMWLNTVRNRQNFIMQEFFYDKCSLVYDKKIWTNQIVLSFYKTA